MTIRPTLRSARSRATPTCRVRFRPAFDGLEARRLLSTITWDGGGDGTSFAQGANWQGGVAPGSGDTAVINDGSVSVKLPGGSVSVGGITQTAGSLTATSGTLSVLLGITLNGGATFVDNGGSIVGSVALVNATLDDAATAGSASITAQGASILEGTLPTSQTLTVQGNATNGDATLTLAAGSNNLGTIVLKSASGSTARSNLAVAGSSTFTNNGTVQVDPDSSASLLTGSFANQKTLDISGASLTLSGSGATLANLAGGVINAWGTLDDSAGAFSNSGTLTVESGAAAALTINGAYNQSSTGALDLELGGSTASGYDVLNVTGAATLAGSLNLSYLNGYKPVASNFFTIVNFGSASGTFGTYNGTNLQDGVVLTPSQASTTLTMTAITAPVSDLNVSVEAVPGGITIGSSVTYIVTVTNDGPGIGQGVYLTDTLPYNASDFSISTNAGSYTTSGDAVTDYDEVLAYGQSLVLTLTTTPPAVGYYVDSASVATDYSFDPNSSNNSGSATCTVIPNTADLTVGVTAQPGVASAESPALVLGYGDITYVTAFQDNGPQVAQGVVVTDVLPTNVTILSMMSNVGSPSLVNNTITLDLASLAPNGSIVVLTVIVQPLTAGTETDTATIGDASPTDPDLLNNTSSASSTVVAPTSITLDGGSPQSAVVGTGFMPLQVTVTDQSGNPVAYAPVTFTGPSTGAGPNFGLGSSTVVGTNSQGVVTLPTYANQLVGSYVVTASVQGVGTPVTFNLTNLVGSPAIILAGANSPEAAVVATAFASPPQVTVTDQYGNPIIGGVVTFTAPASGPGGTFAGGLTTVTATTNAFGVATAPTFTAGTVAGGYAVDASVAGISSPTPFDLTNTVGAAAMVVASVGSPQSAVVGTAYATNLQAMAEDKYGNPIPGATVVFTSPASGDGGNFVGGLKTVSEVANAQGVATAPTYTANTVIGTYAITATVAGVASGGSFLLTNLAGVPSGILVAAGSHQTAVVGTAFAINLQATVLDQYGNVDAGASVTFAAPASGAGGSFAGGLMSVTETTNAQGVATAPSFTANTVAGSYQVTATASQFVSTFFLLANTAGVASSVVATAGSSQTAVVGTAFASTFQASVEDQYGNPVPGAVVTFAAPSSGAGGNFAGASTATATTNALGVATAPSFTAGTIAGGYAVTATVPGVTLPGSFALTNAAGAASMIVASFGSPQSTAVATAFAISLQSTVEDKYGNPIGAGVIVTFAAPSSGVGGSFATGKTATATTNAQGIATAPTFTAGTATGSYVVTATAAGVAGSTSFNLTNAAGNAATIVATAGSPQSAVVATAFTLPLQVTAKDQYGNPDAGITITFTAPTTGPGPEAPSPGARRRRQRRPTPKGWPRPRASRQEPSPAASPSLRPTPGRRRSPRSG